MQKTRALTSEGDAMTNTEAIEALRKELIGASAKSDYYTGYKHGLELALEIFRGLDNTDSGAKSK